MPSHQPMLAESHQRHNKPISPIQADVANLTHKHAILGQSLSSTTMGSSRASPTKEEAAWATSVEDPRVGSAVLEETDGLLQRLAKEAPPFYKSRNLMMLYLLLIPGGIMPAVTLGFDGAMMNGLQAVPTWDLCKYFRPRVCYARSLTSLVFKQKGFANYHFVVRRLQSATRCHPWSTECYPASRLYLRHPVHQHCRRPLWKKSRDLHGRNNHVDWRHHPRCCD